MRIKLFIFFLTLFIHNLCQASYSAEYNALLPEHRRPRRSPEWWKDGMGYTSPYFPQFSINNSNCNGSSAFKFQWDSQEFMIQSTDALNKIKSAVIKNNKKIFASLVSYPLRWNIEQSYYLYLHTPDQVVYHYDAMINNITKEDILHGEPPALLKSYTIIGKGSLWLQCEMKIYAINNQDPNLKAAREYRRQHPNWWFP